MGLGKVTSGQAGGGAVSAALRACQTRRRPWSGTNLEPIQQPIFPAWRAEGPGAAKLGLVSSLPGVQKALERQNLVLGEGRALRLHGQYVAHVVVCLICNIARACRSCTGTATRAQPGQIAPAWTLADSHVRDSPACSDRISPDCARWTDVHSVETVALANAIS